MSKLQLGQQFKLKSTGQRLQISEITQVYKLSPIVATAFETDNMTEKEIFEMFIECDR